MARPNKTNADYFTHDSDMRNDVKVKALRRKFSHMGYAVWCYILEALTDSPEFELPYGEIDKELLAADFDTTPDELSGIVEYCLRLGLLKLTEDSERLYSATHKERFSALLARRLRERKTPQSEAENIVKTRLSTPKTAQKSNIGTDNAYARANRVEESIGEKSREEKIKYPLQDIADLWNSICLNLPKVMKLNETRRKKIKARIDEWGGVKECLDRARELFEKVQASDFLCGGNKNNWTATFDWLFENPSNWVKVAEGNFDNHRGTPRGANTARLSGDINLGIGEYITAEGKRTYGTGRTDIPLSAPPRPSDRHSWDAQTSNWILL